MTSGPQSQEAQPDSKLNWTNGGTQAQGRETESFLAGLVTLHVLVAVLSASLHFGLWS